jgi:hypothetical protein
VALSAAAETPSPADRACEQLSARLQSVDLQACKRLQLRIGDRATRRGRPLLYRDFEPLGAAPGAPQRRVMLIGGIHGDELSSVSIVFQWMRRLQQQGTPALRWRVIPSANPDGLFSRPPTRINASEVDLNRNFPSADWNSKALDYWKQRTRSDPRRYPGASAASESETRWLVEQIHEFKPDAIVSVHAPYGVLD